MKKVFKLLAVLALSAAAAACSSAEKMAELANNVKVQCEPAVLEAVAGNIDATVSVTYPENYFHPRAILQVTPVLVYEGGEAEAAKLMYQGEKVKDNYKVVPRTGGTVTEKIHFDLLPGMEKSHLELRGVVKYKNKSFKLPVKKVADGVNTTYTRVEYEGSVFPKPSGYQAIIKQTAEGQILYNINSANVRSKELKGQSIKDFQDALDEIGANARKTLVGTEIVAYASPDGSESLNGKLSDRRSESAGKAWDKVMKDREIADPDIKSIGEDWEGFQQLVQNSDIEDKDLILRVLSMYSDPAVRENEIKNMSAVYTDRKKTVLPELRRARFIANVEYKNFTKEELLKLMDENVEVLDEPALLYTATLVRDLDSKVKIYNRAIDKFDSDAARYNLAVDYLNAGELDKAEAALAKVETKDADLENALALLAIRRGDLQTAQTHINKAGDARSKVNQGLVDILSGDYASAVENLKDMKGCKYNLGLAYLLAGQPENAGKYFLCPSAHSAYMRAVTAARLGNFDEVKKQLDDVAAKDAALAEQATKDVEFAEYYK